MGERFSSGGLRIAGIVVTLALMLAALAGLSAVAGAESLPEAPYRPQIKITYGPEGPTSDATPAFDFYSEDDYLGLTYDCRFDEAEFAPCTSKYGYIAVNPLPLGPHTFTVRATGKVGGAGTASRSFVVIAPAHINRIGKPVQNRHNGTALLTVEVNQAGTVTVSGPKIETQSRTTTSFGAVKLPIKPTAKAIRSLRKFGHVKLGVDVVFETSYGLREYRKPRIALRLDSN